MLEPIDERTALRGARILRKRGSVRQGDAAIAAQAPVGGDGRPIERAAASAPRSTIGVMAIDAGALTRIALLEWQARRLARQEAPFADRLTRGAAAAARGPYRHAAPRAGRRRGMSGMGDPLAPEEEESEANCCNYQACQHAGSS
jgi:hypothetical protein